MLIKNRLFIVFFSVAAVFLAPTLAHAYTVSGVVDFTYTSYQIRTGNVTISNTTFNEHYQANVNGFIFDPRFLRLTAGVGYNRTHSKTNSDYNSMNYNVNASFFPGRMVSWDLYAGQSTIKIQNSSNIAGYDVDSINYGAALSLRLSKFRSRFTNNNYINNNNGNNNNNSNNNSNNNQVGRRPWTGLSYPDIFITRDHRESESKSFQNPLHETRDNTTATIIYRINSTLDMRLSGTAEDFHDLRSSSSYKTRTADLFATVKVSPTADLKINGNRYERTVNNITGFDNSPTQSEKFGMHLDVREHNRIAQNYGYDYYNTNVGGADYTSQVVSGYVKYKLLPELALFGRLNYSESEYVREATALAPENSASMKSGGLSAGANYKKIYAPSFLDPFVLNTSYEFSTGATKMSTLTEGDVGSGIYYQNTANFGLVSSGWKYENLGFDINYISRRDHSPLNNDSLLQSYRITANTQRLPRTVISANVAYRIRETSASSIAGVFSPVAEGSDQSSRSLDYSASVAHTLNQHVNLSAGATQGRSDSHTAYTLSNLTSDYHSKVLQTYAQALFNYAFTRDLRFNASIREEQRQTETAADIISYQATIAINHRLRALAMSAEWRWREDITDHMPRVFQQSLMLKVARPF